MIRSPPRAGAIELTPTPAMYAPSADAVLQPVTGIRRADDVLPRAAAEEQLGDVAREREPERRPLHLAQVVDEDRDRVEEGAHGRLR